MSEPCFPGNRSDSIAFFEVVSLENIGQVADCDPIPITDDGYACVPLKRIRQFRTVCRENQRAAHTIYFGVHENQSASQ